MYQFWDNSMQFESLVISATLCASLTILGIAFSKFMLIFVISIFEIGSAAILRQFYVTSIFGNLCHFMCHLDQFCDIIFKNHVHIRNQHIWNRLCTDFETILCNISFGHLCHFLCHLDQYGDEIFKSRVYIRNQHVWNRLLWHAKITKTW